MVTLNALLAQPNTLITFEGVKLCPIPPPHFRSSGKANSSHNPSGEFSFSQISHSLCIPSTPGAPKPGSPTKPAPFTGRSPARAPSPLGSSQQDSVQDSPIATSSRRGSAGTGSLRLSPDAGLLSLDLERIPDVPALNYDRYAACPSSVPLMPLPDLSGQVSGQMSGQVSEQVSEQVSGQAATRMSGQFSSRLSGQFSGQFSGQLSGQESGQMSENVSAKGSALLAAQRDRLGDLEEFSLERSGRKRESLEGDWNYHQSFDVYA